MSQGDDRAGNPIISYKLQRSFTLKRGHCPQVKLNENASPQNNEVKYLGINFDQKLTWQTHIINKRKQLGIKLRAMVLLLGRTSTVYEHLVNKIICKAILSYEHVDMSLFQLLDWQIR